ncbi:MAG: 2-oxoglutarate dehydrogenase complex dihydrolipoyllysine-residue succinyltransferase [Alphaproteobacteria bacterium]|jgi:2-oxoglutarate dehydrogenase E2 component (dihydrolipoamide succinyltransferase)
MSVDIVVPTLGESVTEATIARWLKQAGDIVAADEPLVELETDKVTVEVPAPQAGMLTDLMVGEGDNVEVGALLARIGESNGAAAAPAAAAPAPVAPAPAVPAPAAANALSAAGPAAKKVAAETGVSADAIQPTGRDGRATKADVIAAAAAPAPAPAPMVDPGPAVAGRSEERVRMSRLRKRVAERLKEAQNTAAMLTTFNEVDMTEVMAIRNEFRDSFEKRHGVRLGFMSFFTKASIAALREIPAVNAEIAGDEIVYKNYYDIGVAVGTPNGLVVPVIRNAETMTFAGVEKTIGDFGRRARDGKLKLEELSGGTFTISNGGVYGSLMSTPILNPPQSGILGLHKIQQRPMVMPDGSIEARPMMYLAMSYDHRIIDGSEAVTALVRIKEGIEDPRRLLFDM